MCVLIVQQSSYAELLGGGAIPAGPVAGAGGLVTKDAVQPVAVVSPDRGVMSLLAGRAFHVVRIVANSNQPVSASSGVKQSIWA